MSGLQRCAQCGELIAAEGQSREGTRLCALCGARVVEGSGEEINEAETVVRPSEVGEQQTVALSSGPPADEDLGVTTPIGSAVSAPRSEISAGSLRKPSPTGSAAPESPPARSAPTGGTDSGIDRHGVDQLVGKKLGGHVLKKKLGAGGMGAVFLAHQLSLDREVALKVLPARFAEDPAFVARFTREALTAAQLSHHNIVQVFDVGSADSTHYISMEFVRGKDLGSMTRTDGRLDPQDAAGYVLQAARGLYYAHQRGIVHRDIKPDNIMVNDVGIVKVADMGLAKMHGYQEDAIGLAHGGENELRREAMGDLTGASVAMGTPSYMAPEQGQDASTVDHRADQYSLGCTLYYLVAGKAPFSGKTSFEIISKHMSEAVVPLDAIVKNVPKELSAIIEKMLAKSSEDRYPSMKFVIDALESYLGIDTREGPYTPREHHLELLESRQKMYYSAASLKIKSMAKMGFLAGTLLLLAVSALLLRSPFLSAAFLGLLVLTPIFGFIANGILTKDYLFRRMRSVFFGMSLKSWGVLIGGAVLTVAILHLLNLLVPWIVVSVLALGLAVGYQWGIAARVRKERAKPLEDLRDMLKTLRVRGVSEEALQDFVSRYGGAHWEELFEELFGYEAMLLERGRLGRREKVVARKRYATWRDPIVRWLDELEESRRKVREQKQLAKAEKQRLKAEGMSEQEAEKEAEQIAGKAVAEGFLKDTVVLEGVSPSKMQMEKAALDLSKSKGKPGLISLLYRLVRFAAGAAVLAAFAAPFLAQYGVTIPSVLDSPLRYYYGLGYGQSYYAGVAGLLLLLTVFSRRVVLPTLILVGTVIVVAYTPLMVMAGRDPQAAAHYLGALAAAAICVLGGFAMMVLAKLGGGKF